MAKAILIQVTVFDDQTGETVKQITKTYDGSYGYEVESLFSRLGEKLGPIIDPHHYK